MAKCLNKGQRQKHFLAFKEGDLLKTSFFSSNYDKCYYLQSNQLEMNMHKNIPEL